MTSITRFITDTNLFYNLINIEKSLQIPYKHVLNDISTYLNHNNSYYFIPDEIIKELKDIKGIRDFDIFLTKKRVEDPRWTFFTIEHTTENLAYRKILQPLFKGNIDTYTGKVKDEKADHDLIVCALDLAKKYPSDNMIIISNDYQVLDVTSKLSSILKDEPKEKLNRIKTYPSFLFFNNLRISGLNFVTNITRLEKIIFDEYNRLRRSQNNSEHVIEWLRTNQDIIIHKYKATYPEIQTLRSNIRNLNQENEKYKLINEQILKSQISTDDFKIKLGQIIDSIIDNSITDHGLISCLEEYNLAKFTDLLIVFRKIYLEKDRKLIQQFFRAWGKVLNGADRNLALNIRKVIYTSVFRSLIETLENEFKNSNINNSFNLYSNMLPLEIEMDWKNKDDKALLEKFYIIGLYIYIIKGRIQEFNQMIDILENANKNDALENTTLLQFIFYSNMLQNPESDPSISKVFKTTLIQNAEVFYKGGLWNGVWYLLLPIYKNLLDEERKEYKILLENTYWVTLKPPKDLENLWNEVNKEFEIIKGNNLGKSLYKDDISKIDNKNEIPDFLQGNHLITGKSIGRDHVVIHITGRHRRLGIQIQDEKTNFHDCLEIEFEENCIKSYHKCSSTYQDEEREQLSGILKIGKYPKIRKIIKKRDLSNLNI